MIKEYFDKVKINRYFESRNSEDDESYIMNVFANDSNEKELRQVLSGQFYKIFSKDISEKKNLDHILYRINYEINNRSAQKKERKTSGLITFALRIAAVMILALSVYWGIEGYRDHSAAKEAWVEIKAPAWTRAQFSLPDGTTGWLNSNSSIKYNGTFANDRQVAVTGEAFFDVAKFKDRPFRVNACDVSVKVLGTRFNIASYADENNIEVVLEEGRLEFHGKTEDEIRVMNPNDIVVYNKSSKNISTDIIQPEKYISWREGKLVFRNDPIDVIARRIERWYNVEIEISGNLSNDIRLRATFLDESLEEVLYFLGRSLPVDYKIINSNLKPDDTYERKKVIINIR